MDHLLQPVVVAADRRQVARNLLLELQPGLFHDRRERAGTPIEQRGGIDALIAPLHLARLDLGHVEYVVDQTGQPLALGGDDLQELLLGRLVVRVALQDLGERADGSQRSAQFVGDVGQEARLGLVEAE